MATFYSGTLNDEGEFARHLERKRQKLRVSYKVVRHDPFLQYTQLPRPSIGLSPIQQPSFAQSYNHKPAVNPTKFDIFRRPVDSKFVKDGRDILMPTQLD